LRIGVFSDVHGDLTALLRVWSALQSAGLTESGVLNAGDNVAYGDSPEECVRFMRERPQIVCVRGNYDKNVAAFPEREAEFREKWRRARPEKYAAIRDDSAMISEDSRQWLSHLPKEARLKVDGQVILVTHYAPGAKIGLTPETPTSELAALAKDANSDVVVCGHSHAAFVRRAGGVLFVNPGAVGRGFGVVASYAVLNVEEGRVPSAEIYSI
jgi:putative phosphoesterase